MCITMSARDCAIWKLVSYAGLSGLSSLFALPRPHGLGYEILAFQAITKWLLMLKRLNVYEDALFYELRLRGIPALSQVQIPVTYKNCTLRDPMRLDILVDGKIIMRFLLVAAHLIQQ